MDRQAGHSHAKHPEMALCNKFASSFLTSNAARQFIRGGCGPVSDDTTRQGAFRFCDGQGRVITGNTAPVPRLIDLEDLRSIAASIERRGEVSSEALRQIAGAGGSIGGARPKANVLDDGQLWIAKFSSAGDASPVGRG